MKTASAYRLVTGMILVLPVMFTAHCGMKEGVNSFRPEENTVWIQSDGFRPLERNVLPGKRVVWINRDTVAHRVTSGVNRHDGEFESREIPPGGFYVHTFYDNGVYEYYSPTAPGTLRGVIIVGVSGSDLPLDLW